VLFENEVWHVTHQVSPVQLPGFLIVQPHRHVEHIGDLSTEENATLGSVLSGAAKAVRQVMDARKVYIASFGSLTLHVHFYVVPLIASIPADLNGTELLDEVFKGRWACSDEEAADVAARVRVELAKNVYI
jgi:diadenosine tetraphosphate (Ap4A) HIT family hydrolase